MNDSCERFVNVLHPGLLTWYSVHASLIQRLLRGWLSCVRCYLRKLHWYFSQLFFYFSGWKFTISPIWITRFLFFFNLMSSLTPEKWKLNRPVATVGMAESDSVSICSSKLLKNWLVVSVEMFFTAWLTRMTTYVWSGWLWVSLVSFRRILSSSLLVSSISGITTKPVFPIALHSSTALL